MVTLSSTEIMYVSIKTNVMGWRMDWFSHVAAPVYNIRVMGGALTFTHSNQYLM